jgi:hypothetical protein
MAAGMVADCGYYYQDGRQVFGYGRLDDMRKYVQNFTELSIDLWDAIIFNAPRDGPGFIKHVARGISGDNAQIENRPNICNAIIGISKIATSEGLTEGESDAMIRATEDQKVMEQLTQLLKE